MLSRTTLPTWLATLVLLNGIPAAAADPGDLVDAGAEILDLILRDVESTVRWHVDHSGDEDHDGMIDALEARVCGRAAVREALDAPRPTLGRCDAPDDYAPPAGAAAPDASDADADGIPDAAERAACVVSVLEHELGNCDGNNLDAAALPDQAQAYANHTADRTGDLVEGGERVVAWIVWLAEGVAGAP